MNSRKKSNVKADDFRMFDARAQQGQSVARAIDRKTPIPHSVVIHSRQFGDFLETLTPKRYQLLQLSKAGTLSISELAAAAHRDPSAVSKDIAKLADLGLVIIVIGNKCGSWRKEDRTASGAEY